MYYKGQIPLEKSTKTVVQDLYSGLQNLQFLNENNLGVLDNYSLQQFSIYAF